MWKQKIASFVGKKTTQIVATSLVSLGLGAGGTYLLMEKKMAAKYEEISNQEIEKAKNYYKAFKEKPDPEELAARYEDIPDATMEKAIASLREYAGKDGPHEKAIPVVEGGIEVTYHKNVFDTPEWNQQVEESKRNPNSVDPFIISEEEFYMNESENEQLQLTYFEADDILSDGNESPVENRDYVIGEGTLDRFGYGSKDKNIVFVRNPRLDSDIEVIRDSRSFAEVVHGIIQHSDGRRKVRKFRPTDD